MKKSPASNDLFDELEKSMCVNLDTELTDQELIMMALTYLLQCERCSI